MKQTLIGISLLLLVACGAKGAPLTLTVSGVSMADLEPIRAQLSSIVGVNDVKTGNLQDGKATVTLTYTGSGGDLAGKLAALPSALKNVQSFDATTVAVAYGGAAPVAPAAVTPVVAGVPAKTPAPATPAPAPAPTPAPAKPAVPEEPKDKEVKVEVKKDPLAYKVHQLPGGTIATFEGWKVTPMPGDSNWTMIETHPEGKENDFQMIVSAGTPGPAVMANLFEEARKYLQQMMPALKPAGEAQKTMIGGDEARIQDYTAEWQGKSLKVQSIIIRKKDVAVSVLALGSEEAFKEYGRATGITAQSITVKEEPPDPALVGTWLLEKYYSSGAGTSSQFSHSSSMSMTIYPNGTFTESSSSASNLNNNSGSTSAYLDGGNRGKVVKRGTTLSFTYDNGKVWNSEYKMDGGALVMGKNYWLRQR